MRSSPDHAAWQAGPVSASSRIAAVALSALALDSVLTWGLAPHPFVSAGITLVPALLALRVVRALPWALERAAITFALAALGSVVALSGQRHPNEVVAALLVAAVVSATGLGALAIGWAREDRTEATVIALTRSAEHSVAMARRS